MIITTTRVSTDSKHNKLCNHVFLSLENEQINILRGMQSDVKLMFDEARDYEAKYSVRHVSLSPEKAISEDQLNELVQMYLEEFQANDNDYVLVQHQKKRADTEKTDIHYHLLISEVNPISKKIMDNRAYKVRNEKLARLTEIKFGHPITLGRHNKAVFEHLKQEGKLQEAQLIEPLTNMALPNSAFTAEAFQSAKRQGIKLSDVKQLVKNCFSKSDCYPALISALQEQGLKVQEGRKALIIVDTEGNELGSLQRMLSMKKNEFEYYIKEGDKINDEASKQATIEPTSKSPATEPKTEPNESDLREQPESSNQYRTIDRDANRASKNRFRRKSDKPTTSRDRQSNEENRGPRNTEQDANANFSNDRREHKSVSKEVVEQISINQLKQAIIDREQQRKQNNFNENVALLQLNQALLERYKKPEPKPRKHFENLEAKVLEFEKNKKPIKIELSEKIAKKIAKIRDLDKNLIFDDRALFRQKLSSVEQSYYASADKKDELEKKIDLLERKLDHSFFAFFSKKNRDLKKDLNILKNDLSSHLQEYQNSKDIYFEKKLDCSFEVQLEIKKNNKLHDEYTKSLKTLEIALQKVDNNDERYIKAFKNNDLKEIERLAEIDYQRAKQLEELRASKPNPDDKPTGPRGPSM